MRSLTTFTLIIGLAVVVLLNTARTADAQSDALTLYIDADYSLVPAPAEAIEIGLRSAFAGTWAETGIRIVASDHRSNSRRSMRTIQSAQQDPSAIAVVGGMQSPPYFANSAAINQGGVPLLLPWSAGGMLTRFAEGDDNWIFRLSVDDTKAASKLTKFAASSGCAKPSLMFVDNPWGQGNATRLNAELTNTGMIVASSHALPFNAGEQFAFDEVRRMAQQDVDCVILVSGLTLGKHVIRALASLDDVPRIISHWGILGGRLTEYIDYEMMQNANLAILGTCGLDEAKTHPEVYARARAMAKQISGAAFDPELHPAPHGFFHAHDFGLLLLNAIDTARQTEAWAQGPQARREAVRVALYAQTNPIEGLLKTYASPFSPVTTTNFDGHEALGNDDLCMTTVDPEGNIIGLASE